MNDYKTPEYLEKSSSKEPAAGYPTAAQIYADTVAWLAECGCLESVNPALIEDYSLNRRAFLECESMNKQLGRAAKASNGIDLSPYVNAALEYGKASQRAMSEIQEIVTQRMNAKQPPKKEVKRCWKL